MYMVQQRTTTAVRDGYREADPGEVAAQLASARQAREWLASLAIENSNSRIGTSCTTTV